MSEVKMATQVVHWPGDDTVACDDHAEKLKRLGNLMGFGVSSTPCYKEILCANCFNEAKLATQ